MDLRTSYLGFELDHPFMPGASPLVDDIDTVRRLEDAGASAFVMHSLFEEQLLSEQLTHMVDVDGYADSHMEASGYFPPGIDFALGPEEYLEQLRRIKEAVAVPVFGSLNGRTLGGWLRYARLMVEAGADALELNVYELATDPATDGASIEERISEMVRQVRGTVDVPIAVKLSPFYTSLPHLVRRLQEAGAGAVVLFNRLFQPDIDVENLDVQRALRLSSPEELTLRLRWLAILRGTVGVSLAASGGVHTGIDGVKAVMCGADAVQLVSALLRHGPERLAEVRSAVERWLVDHEYESLRQMQGSMSLRNCPDPSAYERTNYVHMLQTWRTHGADGL